MLVLPSLYFRAQLGEIPQSGNWTTLAHSCSTYLNIYVHVDPYMYMTCTPIYEGADSALFFFYFHKIFVMAGTLQYIHVYMYIYTEKS